MKKIFLFVVLSSVFATNVIAKSCGEKRYTGPSNEKGYVTRLIYNYYETKTTPKNACILAKELTPTVHNWLSANVPNNTLASTTKMIYNKIYTGSTMKKLRTLIIGGTGSAISQANTLWKVIKAEKNNRKSMYFFQNSVISPYAYNVVKDKDWVNNTKRYYPNGEIKRGCGSLICR